MITRGQSLLRRRRHSRHVFLQPSWLAAAKRCSASPLPQSIVEVAGGVQSPGRAERRHVDDQGAGYKGSTLSTRFSISRKHRYRNGHDAARRLGRRHRLWALPGQPRNPARTSASFSPNVMYWRYPKELAEALKTLKGFTEPVVTSPSARCRQSKRQREFNG